MLIRQGVVLFPFIPIFVKSGEQCNVDCRVVSHYVRSEPEYRRIVKSDDGSRIKCVKYQRNSSTTTLDRVRIGFGAEVVGNRFSTDFKFSLKVLKEDKNDRWQ